MSGSVVNRRRRPLHPNIQDAQAPQTKNVSRRQPSLAYYGLPTSTLTSHPIARVMAIAIGTGSKGSGVYL
ncbi:hypothetical protein BDZ97DRAFT_1851037 [Flammula alnicola]|nr:hypothetical protein BDZ97DRAFT_1851037 [Flammula alnicola]